MDKENKRNLPAIIYESSFSLKIREIEFININTLQNFDWLTLFYNIYRESIIRGHQGELKQEE